MKEYNVILKKDVDYDGFWEDMETETDGLLYIPNRRIDYTNERVGSLRQCWYLLTDEEAEIVRQDSRVLGVEIPPEHRDDIIIVPNAIQEGVFTKTTSDSGTFHNWGLIRCLSKENNYGTDTTTSLNYTYTLTGNGVDVVIQDSGIQIDHPEFEDENGVSRFVSVDWGSYSGGAFVQSGNHDRDYDGHGTHCAGITAGKTFGWARRARVHHQKIAGLEGGGDSGTGISPTYAFDSIKSWHNSKSIDPNTGYKRPTVVNMSWGYGTFYNSVDTFNYRDNFQSSGDFDTALKRETSFGLINKSGLPSATYITNLRIVSVDTDIEEMTDAGIVVCIAAGNRSNKVDISGGTDYNNYFIFSGTTYYYHRGSSPYSDSALMVGSLDSTVATESEDQKATYSETGPGVTIYAPGTDIMSCTSTTNKFSGPAYYGNASFKQTNISGTSMASPQVAGVAALILELYPNWSPARVKQWLLDNAGTAILNAGAPDDWANNRSLKDGNAKVLHNPFTKSEPATISNVGNLSFNIKIKPR
jgi:subtilisin family serine protease